MTVMLPPRGEKRACIEYLIGVGVLSLVNFRPRWQSLDLPAPTIMTSPEKEGGSGWLLVKVVESEINVENAVGSHGSSGIVR